MSSGWNRFFLSLAGYLSDSIFEAAGHRWMSLRKMPERDYYGHADKLQWEMVA